MSDYMEERVQKTKIYGEYDVVVCGGGIAGIAAALAAARSGAKTVLLEAQYMLGGLATAGLVTIYLPLCDGKGHQLSYGIAEELLRLSVSMGGENTVERTACYKAWLGDGTEEERKKARFEVQYNPNVFAILAEQHLLCKIRIRQRAFLVVLRTYRRQKHVATSRRARYRQREQKI